MLLEFMGSKEVKVCNDGPAALAEMETFRPDVVLLDIGLPGMDGNEVWPAHPPVPRVGGTRLVALTGWGQEADRRRTQASGFDHHLAKPVDIARAAGAAGESVAWAKRSPGYACRCIRRLALTKEARQPKPRRWRAVVVCDGPSVGLRCA